MTEPDVPSGQHRFEPDPYDVADRNPDPACRVCGNGAESPEHDEGAHACVSRLTRCGVCGLGPEPDVPSGERDEAQEIAERALGSGPTDDDTLALAQSIRAYGMRCAVLAMAPVQARAERAEAELAAVTKDRDETRACVSDLNRRAAQAAAEVRALQEDREEDFADIVNERDAALAKLNGESAMFAEARERIGRLEEALRPLVALDNGDRVQLWDFADLFEAGRAALAEPEEPKA